MVDGRGHQMEEMSRYLRRRRRLAALSRLNLRLVVLTRSQLELEMVDRMAWVLVLNFL